MRTEESNSVTLLDKLADGAVDCAMIRLPLATPNLQVITLAEENMLAVLPAGHALERERDVGIGQLKDDPFILFPRPIGPELYDSIIAACHADGFAPKIALESPQISSCVNMAAAGFGVAIIPASIGQVRAAGVTFKPIRNGGLGTAIALVCRLREKSVTVRNFAALVRRHGAGQVE
jgi:DNA-binding transcriptional LysR family regulator